MALTGAGVLKLAAGTVFHKVTCAGGATLGIAANSEDAGRYVDVLAVRDDDDSIAFGSEFKVKKRLDEATGRTVYSARRKLGLVLTYR
jgi:hypothetical protein